jgi:hypothetical protein
MAMRAILCETNDTDDDGLFQRSAYWNGYGWCLVPSVTVPTTGTDRARAGANWTLMLVPACVWYPHAWYLPLEWIGLVAPLAARDAEEGILNGGLELFGGADGATLALPPFSPLALRHTRFF